MKKADLINAIQDVNPRLTKSTIASVVDAMTRAASIAAERAEGFAIPGIVRLEVVDRGERKARNPATGEIINVPAKRIIKARPAGELSGRVPQPS